jgi:ABC-type branched-subunit amino acid transport system ATPase component/branched-subunit amino acid ABC-type transport system permease component
VIKFVNLVLSGMVTGAIYSIMASGLVLTYTTSGIFNFAHGAIAFSVAYLYYQLISAGMPIVPALVLSVFIFAPLLGLALDRLLLRRLASAPVYAKIVGTIGLLIALPALVQWLVIDVAQSALGWDVIGNNELTNGSTAPGIGPTPAHIYHPLHNVALTSDQVAVFAVAVAAAGSLWFLLRHTRAGLEMRAVVDRDTLAGLRGINAARTSGMAWVLTTILAGLGGVLVAPLFQLNDTIFTFVVLGSLAAVVLGGLRSLPVAFIGGLLIGVVQNLIAGYSSAFPEAISKLTGFRSSVPYLLVLVLGLIFGRDRSRQAGSASEDRPAADHRVGLPAWRRRLPWAVFTIALLAFSMQWTTVSWFRADPYWQTVIAQSLAMAIIFLSFVVVTGMGGMVSLAQATFVTAGGFAAGWALSRDWGVNIPLIASGGQLNFFWAAMIATLVGAAFGALIAWPATRLGAVYLAIWSLAAAFFCSLLPFAWEPIGKSQIGWPIRAPKLDIPGAEQLHTILTRADGPFDFSQVKDQILLFLAVFGLLTAAIHALLRSPSGRAMLAVRSSEVAAQASGIRANHTKILVFAVSAGIAGFGGAMLSLFSFSASNSMAPPYVGLFWLALVVVFGVRRPGGALIAGFAFAGGTAILSWVVSPLPTGAVHDLISSAYFVPMLSGAGAIQLAQQPDGILSLIGQQSFTKRQTKQRHTHIAAAEADAHHGTIPDHEQLHTPPPPPPPPPNPPPPGPGIVAGYDGVEVLHGVTLTLTPGKIVALLGANGAGKSTLCAVAAGLLEPTTGNVTLNGQPLTGLPTHQRTKAGLLFIPEARGVFPGLTVEENLALMLRDPQHQNHAYQRFPILHERRTQTAGALSGGEQQMLSLAPALANPPTVFIADEPTLGLAPLVATKVIDAIVELRNHGTAVLIVEEHAQNALRVADTIAFMELGRITRSGPAQDTNLQDLSTAYLGTATT